MRVRTNPNPFSFQQRFTLQPWASIFPQHQDLLDVEIGFGDGNFLERYAMQHKDRSIVGFEISRKLFVCAQETLHKQQLANVHIVYGNGQIGLEDMFMDNSIDRLFIFHPDPWAKRSHHKRRLINLAFLETVYRKLKPQGRLYLSSDVAELWQFMTETIQQSNRFATCTDEIFWQTIYGTYWHDITAYYQRPSWHATFGVIK